MKVKVITYGPISPKANRTLHQLPPGIGTQSLTVSSPWGECNTFSAAEAIYTVPIFCSTWYPLLLAGQWQCGFRACPRLLHMTSAV